MTRRIPLNFRARANWCNAILARLAPLLSRLPPPSLPTINIALRWRLKRRAALWRQLKRRLTHRRRRRRRRHRRRRQQQQRLQNTTMMTLMKNKMKPRWRANLSTRCWALFCKFVYFCCCCCFLFCLKHTISFAISLKLSYLHNFPNNTTIDRCWSHRSVACSDASVWTVAG